MHLIKENNRAIARIEEPKASFNEINRFNWRENMKGWKETECKQKINNRLKNFLLGQVSRSMGLDIKGL